jgi:integrase
MKTLRLETRDARRKLALRHDPYYRSVAKGVAVGYRRAERDTDGVWYLKALRGGRYEKRAIGRADDSANADGSSILSWEQALRLALKVPDGTSPEVAAKGSPRLREVVPGYLQHRAAKSRSSLSVDLDKGKLGKAIEQLGEYRLSELTTQQLARYRDSFVAAALKDFEGQDDERREKQRKAQATANRNWTVLRAVLNWAYRSGLVASDAAWRKVQPFRDVDQPRTRTLTVEECRRLMNAAPADLRLLIRASLLSGLRYGELTRLRVQDFADAGLAVLNAKGGSGRTPLTEEGVEFFEEQCAGKARGELVFTRKGGQAWEAHDQVRPMNAACTRAKIDPPASFHDLRRTYGSLLVNAKAPIAVISAALRHADTRMTERAYAHLLEQTVREELTKALPQIGEKAARKVVPLTKKGKKRTA